MSDAPFMPKATAVWLVENTTLTFKQIAEFCNLHELEIKGIADGDVAKGIKAYNPILAGQISREEIEVCSQDPNKKLSLIKKVDEVEVTKRKKPKYTPLSKDKIDLMQFYGCVKMLQSLLMDKFQSLLEAPKARYH